MTLILTVNGPDSLWLLADRRLSDQGTPTRDDARKVMFLETTDGVAILGYAGLGATALGTEPADWMSAVLRGRNLPLEQSLGVLADALKTQFPPHMKQMRGPPPAHSVLVAAFVNNEGRFYTIDLVFASNRKTFKFRYPRHLKQRPTPPAAVWTPRLGLGGSGAAYLLRDKKWNRPLLRLLRAYDDGRINARAVANHLASLNHEVHLGTPDGSVGPRCIVAWRPRKGAAHRGGAGHQFYTGILGDDSTPSLPTIANGMDLHAMVSVMMPHYMKRFDGIGASQGSAEVDYNQLNAELAKLPDTPDEHLR